MFKHAQYRVRFGYSGSSLRTELEIWREDDSKVTFFSGACEYDCSSVFALKRVAPHASDVLGATYIHHPALV